MKLKKLAAISMTGLMVMGMALPAAAEEAKTGDVNGDGKIVVGYISKNLVDPFHVPINDAAEELLQGMVDDGTIDEFTGILDGNTDGAKQCDLAQDCINMACDYVIILPAEAVASDPAVTSLVDAGTKVVVVNSKTDSTDDLALTYCGSDDVYAGQLMAEYVMEQVPDGGVYVHLQGIIGNSAQIQRGEGIVNTLDSEKWELAADVPCDWAADKAVNAAQDYMAQYGDELKAIICDNDDMSSAAQQTCNEAGREDIVCIGVDGNQGPLSMIKEGTLGATVLQDGVGQVTAGIDAIKADIAGETVEKEYVVPFVLVTSENVDEYLTAEE
ncbi:MAG TPA: substrate-binding domain-containing protein [Candidatus Choladousia intestinavium]|uniref:Substrate-binding domain-containing protein n=1 Tax=Candidatus Choladousia intestinavium TaxID=2840727 RepID=A0A9D1AE46_9FIRM|nr:substrate-binding domain-containing protein [Candidatus Choladousia intestinavium]